MAKQAQKTAPAPVKGKSVATTPKPGDVAKQDVVPDFMRGDAGKGVESLGHEDVAIPRIQLLQAISPEVTNFENARAGRFWHSLAEQDLGSELEVVIIFSDKRYILWNPRDAGGGILARADDGVHWSPANAEFTVKLKGGTVVVWRTKPTVAASGLDKWGTMNPKDPQSGPAATAILNNLVVCPEYPELGPAVVSLQRSALKVGKRLMGKLKLSQAPSFGIKFIMKAVQETGPSGPFYNYRFDMAGYVEPDQYAQYKSLYELFSQKGIRVADEDSLQEEGEAMEHSTGDSPDV